MSQNRKMQMEISRTLKKVSEGLETFDNIYDKIYSASEQSQKERYSSDLKKELKKLQRCRDSIKGWLSNNAVKDKTKLTETRMVIEQKMEQFKECEKEVKTKAFSKEGLMQADEVDPKQKEKDVTRSWINSCMEQIQAQADECEADVESLSSKKRPDKNAIASLEERLKMHKWHLERLEAMLRLMINDSLEPEEADQVRDDVEYYCESNTEPEFYPDEGVYEDLDLDNRTHPKKSRNHSDSSILKKDTDAEQQRQSSISKEKTKLKKAQLAQETREKNREKEKLERRKQMEFIKEQNNERLEREKRRTELNKNKSAQQMLLQQRQKMQRQQQMMLDQQRRRQMEMAQLQQQMGKASIDPSNQHMVKGMQHRALDTSLAFLPRPGDSECIQQYVPKNPAPPGQISEHFPTVPPPVLSSSSVFENVDTDVLFFIFYHQQGTYQQYLAARELKRQSWRFHKKYMTWFQRHEEPQDTTEEYERGTYVYFDYETGWYQRIKSDFTFEYSFLEDELVV
eukprot:GSMAST32.ASY1.ANO1.351.1 assembled CDS